MVLLHVLKTAQMDIIRRVMVNVRNVMLLVQLVLEVYPLNVLHVKLVISNPLSLQLLASKIVPQINSTTMEILHVKLVQ